jgi:hypothetical protein
VDLAIGPVIGPGRVQAQSRMKPLGISPRDLHDSGGVQLTFDAQRFDVRDLRCFDDAYGIDAADDLARGGEQGGDLGTLSLAAHDEHREHDSRP